MHSYLPGSGDFDQFLASSRADPPRGFSLSVMHRPAQSNSVNEYVDLSLDSKLCDLALHPFTLDMNFSGLELAQTFKRHPQLPGVILIADEQFVGMLSRQRFLEYLLLPEDSAAFLKQPLHLIWSYARSELLILPENTTILSAARQALRDRPTCNPNRSSLSYPPLTIAS